MLCRVKGNNGREQVDDRRSKAVPCGLCVCSGASAAKQSRNMADG